MQKVRVFIMGYKEDEKTAARKASLITKTLQPVKDLIEVVCIPEQGAGYEIYKKAPDCGFQTSAFHYQEGKFTNRIRHFVVLTRGIEDFGEKAAITKTEAIKYSDLVIVLSRYPENSSTGKSLKMAEKHLPLKPVIYLEETKGKLKTNPEKIPEIIRGIAYEKNKRVYQKPDKRRTWGIPAFGG